MDYIILLPNCKRRFSIRIPSREEWNKGRVPFENELAIFTDGSKMIAGTGAGVYCESRNTFRSFRLGTGAEFSKLNKPSCGYDY